MMCQYRLTLGNECAIPGSNIDNGGGYTCAKGYSPLNLAVNLKLL